MMKDNPFLKPAVIGLVTLLHAGVIALSWNGFKSPEPEQADAMAFVDLGSVTGDDKPLGDGAPAPLEQPEPPQPQPPVEQSKPEPKVEPKPEPKPVPLWKKLAPAVIAAVLVLWVGAVAPEAFLNHFIVFVLSCVIGYYVVWNVSHSLHTPLMSVTNAISGIIVVGALLQISQGNGFVTLLAFIAILIASINIFGGFYVTRRMLNMFRKG